MPDDKKTDYSWIDEIGRKNEGASEKRGEAETLDDIFSTKKSILPKDYNWNQLPEGNTPSADLEAIKAYLSPDASAKRTTDQDIEYVKELAKDRALAIQEKNITKVRELEAVMLAITPDDRTAVAAQDNKSIVMIFENIQRDRTLSSGGIASSSAQKTAVESMFEDATDTKKLFKTDLDEIQGFILFSEPKNDADTQAGKKYLDTLSKDLYWASRNENFQLAQEITEVMEGIASTDVKLKSHYNLLKMGVNFNVDVMFGERKDVIVTVTDKEIADATKALANEQTREDAKKTLQDQKEFLEKYIKDEKGLEELTSEQKEVIKNLLQPKLLRITEALEIYPAKDASIDISTTQDYKPIGAVNIPEVVDLQARNISLEKQNNTNPNTNIASDPSVKSAPLEVTPLPIARSTENDVVMPSIDTSNATPRGKIASISDAALPLNAPAAIKKALETNEVQPARTALVEPEKEVTPIINADKLQDLVGNLKTSATAVPGGKSAVFSIDIDKAAIGNLDGEKGISNAEKKAVFDAVEKAGLQFSVSAKKILETTEEKAIAEKVVAAPVEKAETTIEGQIDKNKLKGIITDLKSSAVPISGGKAAVFSIDINKEAIARLDGNEGISQAEIDAVREAAGKASLQFSVSADQLLKSSVSPNNKNTESSQQR